ncbi:Kel1p SKDI_08G2050 [Saccharomyces kudriavzevii IFO 1802]|uniref:KEL1-like protein n=2 Tax=Saccharomyces kudriavzevii (strain ATCC MYA-4449 / AS 2.2408 / CBS 8840 / NBRC 1802 / NCYC 2889) TaxID=226230 RepID=J5RZ56_SACK1|nr:uncharacterized protein SKDI_08G2050 [Saccharomyces kudriavzevii IFO 1802]EJT43256.1 KEL1-like protein [Saccharomyces kudriavzevii IFO 1802]CAI4064033.1 hypothetical protein SKDI_08G2050 [Saccharomyces kudriavzevii IFO 1802]
MAGFSFAKKFTHKKHGKTPSDASISDQSREASLSTPPNEKFFTKQETPQKGRQFSQGYRPNGNKTSSPPTFAKKQQAESRIQPSAVPPQQRNVSGPSTTLHKQPSKQRGYTVWNRIKLQNSPFPRYRHVASAYVTDKNQIYVIGGLHDQSVYGDTWILTALDNATKFSTTTIDISEATPPPRVGHAAVLCGNAFVVFGGDTHKVNKEGLMDDDIYLLNINSYKWTVPAPVGPRPLGRYGHKISIIATTQMKTKLYVFGGQFDDTYFNDLAVYDLSSFRRPDSHWEFLKPKAFTPPPITNFTMISYDSKLWVFGGDTLQGLINDVFMYDPAINDWFIIETTGEKPPPVQEHASVVYNDLMCVVGGKDEHDAYLNSVYFLNLKSHKWFKLPVFTAGIPQGRSGHSLTLLKDDKILIMGGDKFDYARVEEFDLHTSDIDLQRGTIVYTLDLARIKDLCPGIMDALNEIAAEKNGSLDLATPVTPVTPVSLQNNSTNLPNSAGLPASAPSSAAKSFPDFDHGNRDVNNGELPVEPESQNHTVHSESHLIAEPNILTPYVPPESSQTPIMKTTSNKPFSTPIIEKGTETAGIIESPNENYSIPSSNYGKNLTPLKQIKSNSSPIVETLLSNEINTFQNDNVDETELHTDADEKTDSTIPSNQKMNGKTSRASVPGNIEEESGAVVADDDDEIGVAQMASSPSKDQFKIKHYNESLELSQKTAEIEKLSEPVDIAIKKSDTTGHDSTEHDVAINEEKDLAGIVNASSDVKKEKLNVPENGSVTSEVVDRALFEKLRSELQSLKELTHEKALEAGAHIKELETELWRLKSQSSTGTAKEMDELDSVRLQSKCEILEADNHSLEDKVNELEDLVNSKFLNMESLNAIVQFQNERIKSIELEPDYKEKLEKLQIEHENLSRENERLRDESMRQSEDIIKQVTDYSLQLGSLINYWKEGKTSSSLHASSSSLLSVSDGNDEKCINEPYGDQSRHHRVVINKLTNRLDDLLEKSQELTISKEKLSSEYHALKMEHSSLSQDVLVKENEIKKIQSDYKESISSMDSASKALTVSQRELEKYKSLSKKLIDELDELNFKNNVGSKNSDGFKSADQTPGSADNSNTMRENQFNIKINDLKAELFITNHERDDLKGEVLELKKRLLNLENSVEKTNEDDDNNLL